MNRYHVKVSNPVCNVKFEMDLLAENEAAALNLALPYASERIASFTAHTQHRNDGTARQAAVSKQVQKMMQPGDAGYWNPATLDIKISRVSDPVIAFVWDLINKPSK